MHRQPEKRPYWLRGIANTLTFCSCLTLLAGILLSSVQADHAGNAEESAADDTVMLQVTDDMARIAGEILETVAGGAGGIENAVGYDRHALLSLDWNDEARTNYVYWPYLRKGLPLEYMSAQQKILTHDLLLSALSSKGYLTAIQIMQLERILADTEVTGFPRGTENYTLAIFGDPAADGLWGWRFEGHHLSLNFALAPGELSVTPSFLGASPAQQRSGTLAGFRSQRAVHDLGLELIQSLDDSQRTLAIQSTSPPSDILSGTLNRGRDEWEQWKNLPQAGVPVAQLNNEQKALAQRIVDEVITTYRAEISSSYLEQVDINSLRFVWFGGTGESDPHYYRMEGADFFFEYDLVQGNGNHVHTVWRSKQGDFGEDLLMQHLLTEH